VFFVVSHLFKIFTHQGHFDDDDGAVIEDDSCVQGMVVCAPTENKKAPEGAFFLKGWSFI